MTTSIVLISPPLFSVLILTALLLTSLSPFILVALLVRDRSNRKLW
ncbi:MAG: hypothetical protein WDZ76_13800 [Pseudohongiellaceae bacterium]